MKLGVKIIAPPIYALLALNEKGDIVILLITLKIPSKRGPTLSLGHSSAQGHCNGGGWYYQTINDAIKDYDLFRCISKTSWRY